jgi:hypothetical protein
MPRYFSLIWMVCVIFGAVSAFNNFGFGAVIFLFPIVLTGFFLSLSVVLIIDRAARILGLKHNPFASKFDWKDDEDA